MVLVFIYNYSFAKRGEALRPTGFQLLDYDLKLHSNDCKVAADNTLLPSQLDYSQSAWLRREALYLILIAPVKNFAGCPAKELAEHGNILQYRCMTPKKVAKNLRHF
jgi:hypothetical protein